MSYQEFSGELDKPTEFTEFTGQLDSEITDTGDETARLAARYRAPEKTASSFLPRPVDPMGINSTRPASDRPKPGLIDSVSRALKPEFKSVLEDYPPSAEEQQAEIDRRLSYGAGPISKKTVAVANEVRSSRGQMVSKSPTVNKVVKAMDEHGDKSFADIVDSANRPAIVQARRDAKAEEFRSVGEWTADTLSAISQGALGLVQLPVNIISPSSGVAKLLRGTQKELQAAESDVLKAQREQLRERVQNEDGFFDKYAATVVQIVTSPALSLSEAVKQIPNFLGVVGAARLTGAATAGSVGMSGRASPAVALGEAISGGAIQTAARAAGTTAGGAGASMVMAGGDAAGGVYDKLTDPSKTPLSVWEQNPDYQKLTAEGKSSKEAIIEIATAKARMAALVTAPLGLFGFMGAAAAVASRGLGKATADALTFAGAGKMLAKDLVGEQFEEGGTQFGGNIISRTVDPNQNLSEGVPEAMATALVTSAPFSALGAASQFQEARAAQAPNTSDERYAAGLLDVNAYDPTLIDPTQTARIGTVGPSAPINFTPSDSPSAQAGLVPIVVPMPAAPATQGDEAVTLPPINPNTERAFGLDKLRMGASDGTAGAVSGATGEPATGLNRPFDRATDADLLARVEASLAGQEKSPQPVEQWVGRKGDGYTTQADASQAIDGRQRMFPELAWKVEQMPGGKFRLAGYSTPQETTLGTQTPQAIEAAQEGQQAPGPADGRNPAMGQVQSEAIAGAASQGMAGTPSINRGQPPAGDGLGNTPEPQIDSPALPNAAQAVAGQSAPVASQVTKAPKSFITMAVSAVKRQGATVQIVEGEALSEQQAASEKLASMMGGTVTFMRQTGGNADAMPNGMTVGRKHIFLDAKADDGPLFVTAHELGHNMPEKLRTPFIKAMRKLFKPGMEGDFKTEFNYDDKGLDEEIAMMMVQSVTKRESFWQDLKTEMGNKDFTEFAKYVVARLGNWLKGARESYGQGFIDKYITDAQAAHDLAVKYYAQAMRDQGMQPDPALMATAKKTKSAKPAKPAKPPKAEKPAKTPKKPAGGSTLRRAAYIKNPLITFMAKRGLFHVKGDKKSLMAEFSPDRQIMVSGYGPVFKSSGKKLDDLLTYAIEDGYLTAEATEADLYKLIQRAIGGERIAPVYSEQGMADMEEEFGAEMESRYEEREDQPDDQWYDKDEADYVNDMVGGLVAMSPEEFAELESAIDDLMDSPAGNMSTRDAMEALGFTEEEIQDEENRNAAKADEAAAEAQSRGAAPGQDAAQSEGLTSYSPKEIRAIESAKEKAKADKAKKDREDEQRAKADAERGELILTGSDRPADVAAANGQQDLLAEPAPAVEPEKKMPTAPAVRKQIAKREAEAKIEDFGEKLGGAKKDMPPSLDKKLTDEEITTKPLSQIWPANEVDDIKDTFSAAVVFAARAEIPAKPRVAYKVKAWVQKVKGMRDLIQDLLVGGKVTPEQFMAELRKVTSLNGFADKVELLNAIDRSQWARIDAVRAYPDAYRIEDGKQIKMPFVHVEIDGKHNRFGGASSVSDVVDRVNEQLGAEVDGKKLQFEIRQNTETAEIFIVKKGDKEYRRLKTFKQIADARAYVKDNYDDLVAAWDVIKETNNVKKTDVRTNINRTRTGEDRRGGKDVTPEQFGSMFGFRGVEFGNWVGQGANAKERQGMLNQAYDALLDLADIVGIPPKAISLNGSMGLAFGSRGSGNAAAHFEPGNLVINLTKTKGAGSLAHEWFHALDNYFARQRGGEVSMQRGAKARDVYRNNNFITYRPEPLYVHKTVGAAGALTKGQLNRYREQNPNSKYFAAENWQVDPKHPNGVRPEVERAFSDVVEALDESPMSKRSAALDKTPEAYWSQIIERGARAFENYVISKMMEKGYQNDYLANVRPIETFPRSRDRYPYLLPEEVAPIAQAFDVLFGTIQTKQTDKGVMLFSRRAVSPIGFYSALAEGIDKVKASALPPVGWKDAIKGLINKGQAKAEEVEWTGLNDWLDLQQGKVTKEQVQDYLNANGVQVQEVVLGDSEYDRFNAKMTAKYGHEWDENLADATQAERDEYRRIDTTPSDATKYAQYTLPGGENYREVLLTLPKSRDDKRGAFDKALKNAWDAWDAASAKDYEKKVAEIADQNQRKLDEYEKFISDRVRLRAEESIRGIAYGMWSRAGKHGDQDGYMEKATERFEQDASRLDRFKAEELARFPKPEIIAAPSNADVPRSEETQRLLVKFQQLDGSPRPGSSNYKSSHWDQPNVLAHIRLNDRTDADGKRVLFVEEIQSDWGQDGKKKGFAPSAKERAEIDALTKEVDAAGGFANAPAELQARARAAGQRLTQGGIPSAPFVGKTEGWLNLALKRVITMAVDGGYDRVAFVNGEQSADRYDLSKQVDAVFARKNSDGTYDIDANKDGETIHSGRDIPENDLAGLLGKDLAEKIAKQEGDDTVQKGWRSYSGDNLKVGGEGMKTFYDKIVPNTTKALLKKLGGGALEVVQIGGNRPQGVMNPNARTAKLEQPGFDITDKMRETVGEGMVMFSRRATINVGGKDRPATNSDGQPIHSTEEGVRNFWKWVSSESAWSDEQGRPILLYHGTNQDILAFDPERTGGLINLTTKPHTADKYASGGGGNRTASNVRVYLDLDTNELFEPNTIEGIAIRDFKGGRGTILTTREIEKKLEYGNMVAAGSGANVIAVYAKGKILDLQTPEGIKVLADLPTPQAKTRAAASAREVISMAQRGEFSWSTTKFEATIKHWENILNPMLKERGYYGIKFSDDNYNDPYTIAVFGRRQIKSATGNTGAFDATNADIRYSNRGLPDASTLKKVAYQGYEKAEVPRVQAARNMAGILAKLDAGKITQKEFELQVRLLTDRMAKVSTIKQVNKMGNERARGADIVREKLLAARRRGEIDPATVEFTLWALQKNPVMAEGLGISVRDQPASKPGTAGEYNPAAAIMQVFKGVANTTTAVHEIMHHTERMMPPKVQEAIRQEWVKALAKALTNATPKQREALAKITEAAERGGKARDEVFRAFADGTLDYDAHYQLVNASEFWAVNATEILSRRHEADSWIAQAKQWLTEMLEKIKGMVGMRSDAPVIRALESISSGDGSFQTKRMLMPGIVPSRDIVRSDKAQTQTPEFKRWFGDSKVVDEQGKPLVVYHGTNADFSEFDISEFGKTDDGWLGEGFYFSPRPRYASGYAKGEGANVMPVYLSMKNPFYAEGLLPDYWTQERLIDAGFDGVIYEGGKNSQGDSPEYVVFSPEQIKSATGNTGAFDPTNPDIRYSNRAYHGTARRGIDKFTTDKMGTGEGAQAYGWGLYFASQKDIAEWYREKLAGETIARAEVTEYTIAGDRNWVVETYNESGDRIQRTGYIDDDELADLLGPTSKEIIGKAEENAGNADGEYDINKTPGQLYEVTIPDDTEMLLWDKPLSEQPDGVKKALLDTGDLYVKAVLSSEPESKDDGEYWSFMGETYDSKREALLDHTGEDIVKGKRANFGETPKDISRTLNGLGIKGIKYLDGTSWGTGDGSYNYVVFSGDDATIEQFFYSRRSNPNKRQKLVGANFTIPATSGFSSFRIKLQDDALRLKRVIEAVKAQNGKVGEAQNFYDALVLMPGRVQASMDDFRDKVMKPLIDKAVDFEIDFDELALYAYAKHAPERNAEIALINPRFPDGGSGMTTADAAKVIAKAKAEGKEAQYEELHQDLMAITSTTRQVMMAEGLISQDEFNALEGAYENYIPLRGLENVDEDTRAIRQGIGRGVNVKGAETMRALGRKSRASDLIENVVRDYERVVLRSEKNAVDKVLLDFVLSNPDPDLWGVDVERNVPSLNKATGLVQYTKVIEKGDDTIGLKVAGVQVYIKLADKEMTRTLRKVWKDETSGIERVTMAVTGFWNNWMRNVLTRFNPVFAAGNIVKDALWSGTTAALAELGPKGLVRYTANYGAALMASGRQEAGIGGTANKILGNQLVDQQFQEFRNAGAITGGYYMRTLEDINNDLRNDMLLAGANPRTVREVIRKNLWNQTPLLAQALASGGMSKSKASKVAARVSAAGAFKLLEFMGAASENATRFALYQAAKDTGKTPAQAALLAKDGTTNFNRKGEWGGALNNLYLFFNAAVQGTTQLAKVLKSPYVQAAMAGMAGVGFMAAMYGASAGGDDDDGEAYWDKIPSYAKERNLIIMLPPGDALAGNIERVGKRGRYISIPAQYGFNIFPNLGYVIADVMRNAQDPKRGMTPTKAALHMTSTVFGSINPLGGAIDFSDGVQVLLAAMPTLADLPIQLINERGVFGTPSAPSKSPWDVRPDSDRMFVSQEGTVSAKIAKTLNELGGGNDAKTGSIMGVETSITPGTIQTLISATTGGLGTFVEQLGSSVLAMTGDDVSPKANKIPFLNKFYGEVDEGANIQTANERARKIKKLADEVSAQEKLDIDPSLSKEEQMLVDLAYDQKIYDTESRALRKEEIDIINDDGLTAKEKKVLRQGTQVRRDKLATEINREYLKSLK